MTFPNTPGFQSHSDTSRVAAALLTTRDTMADAIINHLTTGARTTTGAMAEELENLLGTPRSTINARLRELELEGKVIKTAQTRKSSFDREMSVYVHADFFQPSMGRGTTKAKSDTDTMRALLAKIYKEAHRAGDPKTMTWIYTDAEYETLRTIVKGR